LAQLRQEQPLQYILGVAHFMDLEFKVNGNVLIPRVETEELVRWILDDSRSGADPIRVLDIGTGSGCIAIALAKHLSGAQVHALDISPEALELARENATAHGVEVHFREEDILESPALGDAEPKFDLIVSNPPYVRERAKLDMRNNVKEHELNIALFVPDKDPLRFYGAIARYAQENLRDGGFMYLEINQYHGKETESLLRKKNFSELELRKDLFGDDRMIKAKKN